MSKNSTKFNHLPCNMRFFDGIIIRPIELWTFPHFLCSFELQCMGVILCCWNIPQGSCISTFAHGRLGIQMPKTKLDENSSHDPSDPGDFCENGHPLALKNNGIEGLLHHAEVGVSSTAIYPQRSVLTGVCTPPVIV